MIRRNCPIFRIVTTSQIFIQSKYLSLATTLLPLPLRIRCRSARRRGAAALTPPPPR